MKNRESKGKHEPSAAAPGAGFGPGGYGGYGQGTGPSGEAAAHRREGDSWSPGTATHGLDASEAAPGWQRTAMSAGQIMTREVRCADVKASAADVARIMKEENCGFVPVVDAEQRLVGVITDRDLVLRVAATGKAFGDVRATDAMTDEIEAVTPDESLENVIELMGRRQVRRVPVVDREDRLLGVISMGDVANRADHQTQLAAALERVSSKRGYWSRLG